MQFLISKMCNTTVLHKIVRFKNIAKWSAETLLNSINVARFVPNSIKFETSGTVGIFHFLLINSNTALRKT